MLLLAGSLEKMLAGHNQSMFEYLASGRGGGGGGGGGGQASASYFATIQNNHNQAAALSNWHKRAEERGGQKNEGFKDIVY